LRVQSIDQVHVGGFGLSDRSADGPLGSTFPSSMVVAGSAQRKVSPTQSAVAIKRALHK
jgi:hypothetical protein